MLQHRGVVSWLRAWHDRQILIGQQLAGPAQQWATGVIGVAVLAAGITIIWHQRGTWTTPPSGRPLES